MNRGHGHESRVKMSPNYLKLFLLYIFYELSICTCTVVHGIVEAANYIFNTISNPLYPNSFYI